MLRMKRLLAALTALCLLIMCFPGLNALADSKYYITVDLTNQIVTVYDSEKTDDINIVRQMICSSGRPATPTPQGTFYLPRTSSTERKEWYYFSKFKCYAKYATRITGGILFHSTLFTAAKKGPTSSSTRALGSKASHGCVRLRVNDAKFIAENCLAGTKVRIFASGKTNASLRSKLKKKTFIRDNQTYDSFLGRKPKESPLPLSKGSTGTLVTQLQTRLKALGYYSGAVNGTMGKSTVTAVKAFQGACQVKKSGTVNQTLWDVIFSDVAAPIGNLVTLSEGSSGPVVSALQANLTTLLMYSGSIDGSFGSETAKAVTDYQNTFGYAASGSADTDLQKDIAERAAQVKQDFGDTPYALGTVTVDAQMAKVKAKYGTKLRKTASKKGKALKSLKKSAAVRVLSKGKTWIRVKYGTTTGYVKKSALKFYTEAVTESGYVRAEATPAPTVEPTPTPEIYIPTEADTDPAAALEAELVYGTEPVETPAPEAEDDGLAIEPEETPAPEIESIEEDDAEAGEPVEAREPEEAVVEISEE